MKKLFLIVILTLFNGITNAQNRNTAIAKKAYTESVKTTTDSVKASSAAVAAGNKQFVRIAANLKSGTSQDVLSSFFKLAFSDLKDGRHFQFNSSLFAVRAKTDSTLWIDTNYKKQAFARNFVFGIDYGLDSNYKFKSTAVNVKYALINNRDKSVFNFSYGKKLIKVMDAASHLFNEASNIYFNEDSSRFKNEHRLILNFFFYNDLALRTKSAALPKRFVNIVDSLAKLSDFAPVTVDNYQNMRDSINNMYKTAASLMAQQSLWTISSQITADKSKLISKTNFNSEYLKGITKNNTSMGLELDIKANLSIYDSTIINTTYHRNVFAASAGINWIIYKDKTTQKSYVEFKPALAYDNVLGGLYTGETKSRFTADGVFRFRVTDDFWIPIDIKYDPKAGKFFGFLNITSNFDWLGSKSKASGAN
jgi:hypothetical protein